jgi:hypothetical protein
MTTPRDAIGLSDRLRERIRLLGQSPDSILKFMDRILPLIEEAATALDSLQARVVELEENITEIPQLLRMANARATSAAQERDELRGLLLLCGELGGIGKDETPAAYLRRLIDGLIDAHRERDEAYERAAQCAECIADEYDATSFTSVVAGQVAALRSKEQAAHEIAAAIRRLAAGTEKEKQ